MMPFVNLFGRMIPSYGLSMAAGMVLACLLAVVRLTRAKLAWEPFAIIAACTVGLGLFGAGVMYMLVTYPVQEIIRLMREGQFGLLMGGAVFYGGLIGGGAGSYLGSRIARVSLWTYEPAIVPALPLAHAFGRLGCFCAGCCYGIPAPPPLGIAFLHPLSDAPAGQPLLPVQLLEAGANIAVCVLLLLFFQKKRRPAAGLLLYLMMYSLLRFLLEYLRYDAIRGHLLDLSTSQWVSLLMFSGAAVLCICRARAGKTMESGKSAPSA